ncbi:MAG: flavodoxin domain-containing protein [Chloroflexi bacterium]|jgi:hypothetical protein|nr:flavodoxin domain-containing protein [Chloroflexota bacterium]
MRAVVVYESLWGNTAAIARAIAEGLGPGARALSTKEATADAVAGADLLVAGAPILGFRLPTEQMRESASREATPPDLTCPSMRSWLSLLAPGGGRSAAFETRISWSPGSAASAIDKELQAHGYARLAPTARFVVKGKYGPLRDGEIEKARAWGADLARAMGGTGTA